MMVRQKLLALLALAATIAVGCDTTKVKQAVTTSVDAAKNTVNQTVEAARQEINLAGSMDLSTTPPIAAKACYAKLVAPGGERPNVLQLASCKSVDLERFPSVFLQAPVKTSALSELAGQTLQAELYAQLAADGTVWRTRTGQPAAIRVAAVDATSLTAECSGVMLVNAETGEEAAVSGKFIALLE